MQATLTQAFLAQPEATTSAPSHPAGGGRGAGPDPMAGCATQSGLLLAMFAVFYFLLIRPQRKQEEEHRKMIASLRKGDVVRTRGGIRGEVTALDEREVTLEVADRVRIKVLRSAIADIEERDGKPLGGAQAKGKGEGERDGK